MVSGAKTVAMHMRHDKRKWLEAATNHEPPQASSTFSSMTVFGLCRIQGQNRSSAPVASSADQMLPLLHAAGSPIGSSPSLSSPRRPPPPVTSSGSGLPAPLADEVDGLPCFLLLPACCGCTGSCCSVRSSCRSGGRASVPSRTPHSRSQSGSCCPGRDRCSSCPCSCSSSCPCSRSGPRPGASPGCSLCRTCHCQGSQSPSETSGCACALPAPAPGESCPSSSQPPCCASDTAAPGLMASGPCG